MLRVREILYNATATVPHPSNRKNPSYIGGRCLLSADPAPTAASPFQACFSPALSTRPVVVVAAKPPRNITLKQVPLSHYQPPPHRQIDANISDSFLPAAHSQCRNATGQLSNRGGKARGFFPLLGVVLLCNAWAHTKMAIRRIYIYIYIYGSPFSWPCSDSPSPPDFTFGSINAAGLRRSLTTSHHAKGPDLGVTSNVS